MHTCDRAPGVEDSWSISGGATSAMIPVMLNRSRNSSACLRDIMRNPGCGSAICCLSALNVACCGPLTTSPNSNPGSLYDQSFHPNLHSLHRNLSTVGILVQRAHQKRSGVSWMCANSSRPHSAPSKWSTYLRRRGSPM